MDLHSNREMLAGVCSWLAARLRWNVWAIRAVLLILLVAQPIWTALGYAVAAVLLGSIQRGSFNAWRNRVFGVGAGAAGSPTEVLRSPELKARKQRIDDLEQRFREWERSLPKDQ
jgi:phage shock protein PspC (stress-responsive transcriptional regulator)